MIETIGNFFHVILSQPLLNALIWIYNFLPGESMGLAIIALTVLVRLLLFPSFQKSLKSQKELQRMQPKIDEIKEKFKGDQEGQAKAIMAFYKENKINPFSSCLPLLIQLPILIALYRVFLSGLNGNIADDLYPFVANPENVNTVFLGMIDLAERSIPLAALAGIFQFIQTKMLMPKKKAADKTARIMNAQMTYFMPLFTVFIAATLPAGLAVYWIVTTLFAIAQQFYILKKDSKIQGSS